MNSELKLLLTGFPGVGKTTVIRRFLALTKVAAGGFYTEEIRRGGQRFGFSLNILGGEQLTLASVELGGRWRVGKYGVDLPTFEAAAIPAIEAAIRARRLVVMDEMGKMELFSEAFRRVIERALDSPSPVLGTILSQPHPFADRIRNRCDVRIVEVTRENRDRLPGELARLFGLEAVAGGL